MSSRDFSKICTPAKLYFALAILSIIMGLFGGIQIVAVLGKLLFALIWTFILSWLCKIGLSGLSWFLVLLPFIMILLVTVGLFKYSKTMNLKTSSGNFMM